MKKSSFRDGLRDPGQFGKERQKMPQMGVNKYLVYFTRFSYQPH